MPVKGLGAAAATPAALAMLTTTFPEGPRRVRALGVWSGVNAAGGALGVLAGGLLTEYAGWRWVMLINLPIVAVALALVLAGVPAEARPARRERLDVLGAVLATGGVGLLVFGVVRTDAQGWGSPATVAMLAAAAVLLAAFVFAESRAPAPLLRLGLLRSRWVAGANVLVFFAAAGQFAAFYFVSLYMQQVLGMGAAATGAAFLPFSASLVAGTVVATRVTAARTPRASLVPGALLAAAGLAWFAFISPGGGFLTDVLGPCIITGVGVGLVLAPVVAAATTGVAPREAGMASGLINSSRQLGGCVGLAVLATVAAHRTGTATDPAALNDGYALGLAVAAGLFALAAVVAIGVLPRRWAARTRPATRRRPDREPTGRNAIMTTTPLAIDLFASALHVPRRRRCPSRRTADDEQRLRRLADRHVPRGDRRRGPRRPLGDAPGGRRGGVLPEPAASASTSVPLGVVFKCHAHIRSDARVTAAW